MHPGIFLQSASIPHEYVCVFTGRKAYGGTVVKNTHTHTHMHTHMQTTPDLTLNTQPVTDWG